MVGIASPEVAGLLWTEVSILSVLFVRFFFAAAAAAAAEVTVGTVVVVAGAEYQNSGEGREREELKERSTFCSRRRWGKRGLCSCGNRTRLLLLCAR